MACDFWEFSPLKPLESVFEKNAGIPHWKGDSSGLARDKI